MPGRTAWQPAGQAGSDGPGNVEQISAREGQALASMVDVALRYNEWADIVRSFRSIVEFDLAVRQDRWTGGQGHHLQESPNCPSNVTLNLQGFPCPGPLGTIEKSGRFSRERALAL